MKDVRIIALDLDGTLLNGDKELTEHTREALTRAAEKGIEIVPTTGRLYKAIPDAVRTLPFIHYAITINGAQVYDIARDLTIAKAEIPTELSIRIMTVLDQYPIIYDSYIDSWGYMSKAFYDQAHLFVPNSHSLKLVKDFRTPVPDMIEYIRKNNYNTQKIQLFSPDKLLYNELGQKLSELFPELVVSSSGPTNIELNIRDANKGHALKQLAEYIGVDVSKTVSFGDSSNDLSMIRDAGIGVAMANSCDELLAICDEVTLSNDEDGVAVWIENNVL